MTEDTRPTSSYAEQMTSLRNEIASLGSEFGIPTYRRLIIARRVHEEEKIKTHYFEITPTPLIERKAPTLGTSFNSEVQIKVDELKVFGITREIPREWIVGTGISYFLDADILGDKISGGFEADFVSIDEMPFTWNLVLRRRPDERRGV